MTYINQESNVIKYDSLCATDIMATEYTFVWKISKFSSRMEEPGEKLVSEVFSIQGPGKMTSEWYAVVCPRGFNVDDLSDFVSVFLYKKTKEDVNIMCVLSVLNASKVKQKLYEFEEVRKFGGGELNKARGWNKCIERNSLPQYTPDETLTLIFEITVFGESRKSIEYKEKKKRKNEVQFPNFHYKKMVHDMESLLRSQTYTDVLVTCGNKKFQCHKNILTCRSPVFKTMLESNMKEKEAGSIEIKDMKLEVFEDLLKYIYSGEAPNIDEHAEELFAAADLYQLEHLKELCEVKLCAGIDITNCINLLVLGELHHASTLKASALKFVSKNMLKINSSEWKQSLIAYPTLFAEVMEMMLNTDDEKKRNAFS